MGRSHAKIGAMAGLVEVPARQFPNEDRRRWFTSANVDLVLWLDEGDRITAFQVCYAKRYREKAIVWTPERGLEHMIVDDGDVVELHHKATPILVPDRPRDVTRLAQELAASGGDVPSMMIEFVVSCLRGHGTADRSPAAKPAH